MSSVIVNAKRKGLLKATLCLLISTSVVSAAEPLVELRVDGKLPFTQAKAIELASLPEKAPLDDKAAGAAAARIRDACRRRHYPQARVEWRREPSSGGRQALMLRVDCGRQGKLKEVRFSGRKAIKASELRRALRVSPKPAIWSSWLGQDAVLDEDLDVDRTALTACYHKRGYAAAKIGEPVLEWLSELNGFRLTWPIQNEGPVYKVGYIGMDAVDLPSDAALRRIIRVNAGDLFERRRVQEAVKRFEAYYQDRGHAFASVVAQEEWDDAQASIDLLFKATPGTKPVLRKILVSGNTNTADRIILREIALKPGQPFDAEAVREALARLSALPMFSDVAVNYHGAADLPEFDLAVEVVERPSRRVELGVIYGEAEGAALQVNLIQNNLSLTPPFQGDGLQSRLGATLGSEIIRGDAELRNPRLYDSRWILDLQSFYEDSEGLSDYYAQRTAGGNVLFSHPLGLHHMVSAGYGITGYDVYDLDAVFDDYYQPSLMENQDLLLTSLIFAWNMDYANRLIRPTRGIRMRGSVSPASEALGGDTDIVQTELGGSIFMSPFFKHVVSLRGGVKSVDPYGGTDEVALPVRSFLGGSRDLRGFEYRSVSPLDEEGRAMGGQSAWWATTEYRVPVPMLSWLDIALYYDVGDVSLDSYTYTGDGPVSNWGIGLLVQAEEFPVRFDFATPITTIDGDRQNEKGKPHISFSAGYRF